jgi:hypothetical protein
MLDLVRRCYAMLIQVRSVYDRLGQARQGYASLG